jgi:hypothetical protein
MRKFEITKKMYRENGIKYIALDCDNSVETPLYFINGHLIQNPASLPEDFLKTFERDREIIYKRAKSGIYLDEIFKKVTGIYAIECLKNNMIYVGSSKNLYRRVYDHKNKFETNNKRVIKDMMDDYNAFGPNYFITYCLEIVNDQSKETLLEIEEN